MSKTKEITAEKFFNKPFALLAWKKAKNLFDQTVTQEIPVADGLYPAVLTDIKLIVPIPGRCLARFFFTLENRATVTKNISIEAADGIIVILWELSRLGIKISNPVDIDDAFRLLKEQRIIVELVISSVGTMRFVSIASARLPQNEAKEREAEPDVRSSVEKQVVETEPEKVSAPEPIKEDPIKEAPVQEDAMEVDIRPGHRVVIKIDGNRIDAEVLKTFEEENEIAVKLENGSKIIISGNDIVEFIG